MFNQDEGVSERHCISQNTDENERGGSFYFLLCETGDYPITEHSFWILHLRSYSLLKRMQVVISLYLHFNSSLSISLNAERHQVLVLRIVLYVSCVDSAVEFRYGHLNNVM